MNLNKSGTFRKRVKQIGLTLLMIIIGTIFCFLFPVLIKQFLLKPLRFLIFGENQMGKLFQWISSLFFILAGYFLFIRITEKRNPGEISHKKLFPGLFQGWVWGVGSISFILVILFFTGNFQVINPVESINSYNVFVLVLLLVITEEIIYRGILYKQIEKRWGILPGLIISALVFSAMHFSNDHYTLSSFLAILLGGSMMSLMYSLTKNLWWPIAAHFGWNWTQTAMGLRLSGMDDFNSLALFKSELTGSDLLTGGNFGVENSLVTIGYTLAVTVFLIYLAWKKGLFNKIGK